MPQNKFCHLVCHMSRPWLYSHAPSSMSTFSFFTYPTTQREHSAHPAHLQDHSVDKLRHQESLRLEDMQSGGNPRTTTPTGTRNSFGRIRRAIPSFRSMLSSDKKLPLDTCMEYVWTTENVFGNQFFYTRFIPKSFSRSSFLYETRCHRIGSSAYWDGRCWRKR